MILPMQHDGKWMPMTNWELVVELVADNRDTFLLLSTGDPWQGNRSTDPLSIVPLLVAGSFQWLVQIRLPVCLRIQSSPWKNIRTSCLSTEGLSRQLSPLKSPPNDQPYLA